MAFREVIQVQKYLVKRAARVGTAAVHRILLALLGAYEIEIAAESIGNRQIRLKNAPEHFLVQRFLKSFGRPQGRIGIHVFRLEIGDDLRVFFLAEPSVMVHAAITMQNSLDRLAAGERRR